MLSEIASFFDPLGLAGPVILTAKIKLQKLWQKQLEWDQLLDDDDHNDWNNFRIQLRQQQQIEVPRRVVPASPYKTIKLIGFCDGSTVAYGACVYIYCVDNQNYAHTSLLCAKSRVAPIKTITVPRLELCSAVLLSQLVTKVIDAMEIQFDQIILWSDSTITLSWIKTPSNRLKTFVAHRITEIQELTNPSDWRHIPTDQNPADIMSRGLLPSQLQHSSLWWFGPAFLRQNESTWPNNDVSVDESELPEVKSTTTTLITQPKEEFSFITKFSNPLKSQRIMAYVLRFIANCRIPKNQRRLEYITAEEMSKSLIMMIRLVQQETFQSELKALERGIPLTKSSSLMSLNVFLDKAKLIRVGGRLRNSGLQFDTKHQIVLPKHHHFTWALLRSLHEQHGHVGQQGLLSIVRQSYWPIRAKDAIKRITQKCVWCFRHKPKAADQYMGDLPAHRSTICFPFWNTGVDFAGPLQLKMTRRTTTKAYIAIFVCMATKAVHVELVSELSTNAFLAALTRFISRRGHCKSIYCDNATNFVGAKNELQALYNMLNDADHQRTVANTCAAKRIEFHFIPPRAPHFGGLWEAAVKSTKFHLVRIVGTTLLSFEEMTTVLVKIEAILNSRPLIAESDDPEDFTAITPGHFLIGRPLVAIIEPDYTDVNTNRLRRWQLLQQLTQHFWKRWSVDYLSSLQKRTKTSAITQIQVGSLALLKEDNLPPTRWVLGRITALHPGQDGLVRVVTVRTNTGEFKRPLVKICLLPTQDDDEHR
jgi:hypothetical protein